MAVPEVESTAGSVRGGPADRRRHPRRAIPGIVGSRHSPGDVTVLDLSLTGFAAEAVGELEPGQHCFFELVHQRQRVHVEALVRWASLTRLERGPQRFVPVFRAGLSFVDIDRQGTSGIWDWILTEAEEQALTRPRPVA